MRSRISAKAGANAKEVAKMGLDTRIGSRFSLCRYRIWRILFSEDVQALRETGKEYGMQFTIIESADALNDRQKMRPVEFWRITGNHIKESMSLCGGFHSSRERTMSVKPRHHIAAALLKAGAQVTAFDPVATESFKAGFS